MNTSCNTTTATSGSTEISEEELLNLILDKLEAVLQKWRDFCAQNKYLVDLKAGPPSEIAQQNSFSIAAISNSLDKIKYNIEHQRQYCDRCTDCTEL